MHCYEGQRSASVPALVCIFYTNLKNLNCILQLPIILSTILELFTLLQYDVCTSPLRLHLAFHTTPKRLSNQHPYNPAINDPLHKNPHKPIA